MLQNWYTNMTARQRKFVWALSIITLPVLFIGVIPTLLLIYLHLGTKP